MLFRGMRSGAVYCFSSRKTKNLFALLYPELKDNFLDGGDLLRDYGYSPPDEKEHELAFLSLLPKDTEETVFLETYQTLLVLREALILKQEHVDHCFSLLGETKKNLFLKSLLTRYLNSPLAFDYPHFLWEFIGALKDKKHEPHQPIYFIEEAETSLLFLELAATFVGLNSESRIMAPWEIASPESLPGNIFSGATSESLSALGSAIGQWKATSSPSSQLWIPFFGEEKEEDYLKFCLAHEGISYHSTFERTTVVKNHPLDHLIQILRSHPGLPLKTRFTLNETLIKNRHLFLKDPEFALKTLGERKEIPEESLTLLQSFLTPMASQVQTEISEPQAILFPFIAISPRKEASVLGFCNEDYLKGDKSLLLFSEPELESLYMGGYPLPRRSSLIAFRKKAFSVVPSSGMQVFTSLAPESFKSLAKSSPAPIAPLAEPRIDNFQVNLKSSRLSATQLETFSECPAKYFFLNRLRLRKALSFQDSYSLILGQTTHLALENACKASYPLSLPQLEAAYQEALKTYLPEHERNSSIGTILNTQFQLICERVMRLEETLMTYFGEGHPLLIEEPFEITLAGLKFTGKIDRVDLRDGRLIILDYKTGNVDFTPEHIRKGYNFQALLYLLAIQEKRQEPTLGMLFYDLKEGELRRGLLIEEEVSKETKKAVTRGHTLSLDKFSVLGHDGIQRIREVAEKIALGQFDPTPSAENCSYCEAKGLCRKAVGYV